MGKVLGSFGLRWDYEGHTGIYLDDLILQEEWCVYGKLEDISGDLVIWGG